MDSFMYGVDCRGGYSTYSPNSNYACDLKKKFFFLLPILRKVSLLLR